MDYLSKIQKLRPTKSYSEKFTAEMLETRREQKN